MGSQGPAQPAGHIHVMFVALVAEETFQIAVGFAIQALRRSLAPAERRYWHS